MIIFLPNFNRRGLKFNPWKATDDSQKTDDLDGDDIERAAGFNFARLKERYPELKTEIRKFAKYASDTSSEIQPMKAWQMGDLSLQASVITTFLIFLLSILLFQFFAFTFYFYLNSFNPWTPQNQAAQLTLKTHETSPDQTFATLGDIVGNFPQQAKKLSRVEVPKKLRKSIEANQEMVGRSVGLHKGNSYFSINGMQVDLTSQWGDPFQLLETVRGELDTMERLVTWSENFSEFFWIFFFSWNSKPWWESKPVVDEFWEGSKVS